MNKDSLLKKVFFFLFSSLGLMLLMAVFYINRNFAFYNTNPISQILFHLLVQVDGANPKLLSGMIAQIALFPIIASFIITIFLYGNISYFKKIQNNRLFVILKKYSLILSVTFFAVSFILCAKRVELKDYIESRIQSSTIYEDEYIDPSSINYDFPEKKRNLIYIFLESMETSDYSIEQGGAFEKCYIPELYNLANENITFNKKGFYVAPNTGWTVAAMVSQSSGVPLNIPIAENEFVTEHKFLPGAYSLGDLLNDNGYHNVLLLGSDAVFGGREFYYKKHGNYDIHDYDYALQSGLVSEDQFVWWGYEDYKLFNFAKNELTQLSNNDEPFNLTMLTVDTHDDGYECKYCKNEFDEKLANTYACTSRQVCEFVEWCKQQDFYENTTIIIAGDHCSMDEHFESILDNFDRRVYYTIINPSQGLEETKDRIFCTFDLYPTTIASLGIQASENRIALGTNLFSGEETLCEKYGKYEFFMETSRNSNFYNDYILYGIK